MNDRSHTIQMPVLVTPGWTDYQLIDFGAGRKLERFGPYVTDRPEEQAMCAKQQPDRWAKADAVFDGDAEDKEGRWRTDLDRHASFPMRYNDLAFHGRFTAFRHMGVFPEQAAHWEWMERAIKRQQQRSTEPFRLLNLFGYTGIASLVAARAGAEVTHVDASKKAVGFARENQNEAKLDQAKIRWIVEDAVLFVQREIRRGKTYHGILLDPPKFGRGPNGEVWDLFTCLPQHLHDCVSLLGDDASFLILTAYAIRASALSLQSLAAPLLEQKSGHLESGELAVAASDGRLLPTSLFARWSTQ